MSIYCWTTLIIGVVIIILHGITSIDFKIDKYSLLVLFIIFIPCLAKFLQRAKIFGNEFVFKDEISDIEKLVQSSKEQTEAEIASGEKKYLPFETFSLESAKGILESDHILSLAALRIEIESVLRTSADFLKLHVSSTTPLRKIIDMLLKMELLFDDQVSALKKIIDACNKAIHGAEISQNEANQIINLTEELNKSFSIGYSLKFFPNEEYESQNLICQWNHCIEWMPLRKKRDENSCPLFGHDCPGGPETAHACRKMKDDILQNRIVDK